MLALSSSPSRPLVGRFSGGSRSSRRCGVLDKLHSWCLRVLTDFIILPHRYSIRLADDLKLPDMR